MPSVSEPPRAGTVSNEERCITHKKDAPLNRAMMTNILKIRFSSDENEAMIVFSHVIKDEKIFLSILCVGSIEICNAAGLSRASTACIRFTY